MIEPVTATGYSAYVYSRLEATIAQANADDSVTVTVWIER